jgi:hypothetical protein
MKKCPKCGSDQVTEKTGEKGILKCACGHEFPAKRESMDPAKWRKLDAAAQNTVLCESGAREELNESVLVNAGDLKKATNESSGPNALFDPIKVSQGNKPNANDRIYPEAVLAVAIERVKDKIKQGMFGGAVDHPGYGDGVLKDSPIIWRDIAMDAMAVVKGRPEIVSAHSRGADLLALINAGRGIGFSTRGYGSAHRPTPEEIVKYGLKEGDEDRYVIINDDFDLIGIDAVDDPAVRDAVMAGGTKPASKRDSNEDDPNFKETVNMKDLNELKTAHPALFAQHEQAVTQAVRAAVTEAETPLKTALKDAETAKATAEAATATATADLKAATDALATETASKAEIKTKLDAQEAANKNLERRAAVVAALPKALKDNKFATQIRESILGKDGKGGRIEDDKFDVAAAEAFIKEKTAEYEGVMKDATKPNKHWPITGEHQETEEEDGKSDADEVRENLRL